MYTFLATPTLNIIYVVLIYFYHLKEHQEQAKRKAEHRKQMEKARKKSELEQIKKGKRPYYMKKCK